MGTYTNIGINTVTVDNKSISDALVLASEWIKKNNLHSDNISDVVVRIDEEWQWWSVTIYYKEVAWETTASTR